MKILITLILAFSFIGCGICHSGRTVRDNCIPTHKRIHKPIKVYKYGYGHFMIQSHKMHKMRIENKDRKVGVHREKMRNNENRMERRKEMRENNIRRQNSYGNEDKRIHQERKKEEKRNTRQNKKF